MGGVKEFILRVCHGSRGDEKGLGEIDSVDGTLVKVTTFRTAHLEGADPEFHKFNIERVDRVLHVRTPFSDVSGRSLIH